MLLKKSGQVNTNKQAKEAMMKRLLCKYYKLRRVVPVGYTLNRKTGRIEVRHV